MPIKKKISEIDARLFGGSLKKTASWATARMNLRAVRSSTDHRIEILHRKNAECELARLCDLYGSDKGAIRSTGHPYPWPPHSYADFYEMLFGHCREQVRRLLECGLGTNNPDIAANMGIEGKPGASLRVWRDYFPNAEIFGIDIDESILFSEHRIRTYRVDQTSPNSITQFWNDLGVSDFDIILDDGLHQFRAGICLFENSIARLSPHGVYLIEDVAPQDMIKYVRHFDALKDRYLCRIVNLYRPTLPLDNNSLLMITWNKSAQSVRSPARILESE